MCRTFNSQTGLHGHPKLSKWIGPKPCATTRVYLEHHLHQVTSGDIYSKGASHPVHHVRNINAFLEVCWELGTCWIQLSSQSGIHIIQRSHSKMLQQMSCSAVVNQRSLMLWSCHVSPSLHHIWIHKAMLEDLTEPGLELKCLRADVVCLSLVYENGAGEAFALTVQIILQNMQYSLNFTWRQD